MSRLVQLQHESRSPHGLRRSSLYPGVSPHLFAYGTGCRKCGFRNHRHTGFHCPRLPADSLHGKQKRIPDLSFLTGPPKSGELSAIGEWSLGVHHASVDQPVGLLSGKRRFMLYFAQRGPETAGVFQCHPNT